MPESSELTIVREIRAALGLLAQERPKMAATLLLALANRLLDQHAADHGAGGPIAVLPPAPLH